MSAGYLTELKDGLQDSAEACTTWLDTIKLPQVAKPASAQRLNTCLIQLMTAAASMGAIESQEIATSMAVTAALGEMFIAIPTTWDDVVGLLQTLGTLVKDGRSDVVNEVFDKKDDCWAKLRAANMDWQYLYCARTIYSPNIVIIIITTTIIIYVCM